MGCCKGYTAKCIECGLKGCDRCQVSVHTGEGSYCYTCYDNVSSKSDLETARKRIEYLKSLLKQNHVKYDHSDNSYDDEESHNWTGNSPDNCKTK